MDDIDIPKPNPALAQILLSSQMQNVVRSVTELAKTKYQAIVAKRSGKLAASARVRLHIGGHNNDRWVGTLTVGEATAHGLAHEFGHKSRRDTNTGAFVARSAKRRKGLKTTKSPGAKDLKKVLRSMRD